MECENCNCGAVCDVNNCYCGDNCECNKDM